MVTLLLKKMVKSRIKRKRTKLTTMPSLKHRLQKVRILSKTIRTSSLVYSS